MAKLKRYKMPKIDLRAKVDYEELLPLRRKLSKVVNERMRQLEKQGLAYYAYTVTNNYLKQRGLKRFSEALDFKGNRYQLKDEINELITFLNSKSGSVRGQREIIKERKRFFEEEYGIFLKSDKELTPREIKRIKSKGLTVIDSKKFFDVLDSTAYKHLKKYGISEEIVDYIDRAYNEGASIDEILSEIEKFDRGEIEHIDELFERQGLEFISDEVL